MDSVVPQEAMEMIIDRQKLKDCRRSKLGILITLKRSFSTNGSSQPTVVVGQCACARAAGEITKLSSLGIPTPNWAETVDFAKCHFPSGCDVGVGVWASVSDGSEEDEIKLASKFWETISSETNVKEALNPSIFVMLSATTDQCEVNCFQIDPHTSALTSQSVKVSDQTLKGYLTENTILLRLMAKLPLYILQDKEVWSAMSPLKDLINDPSTVLHIPSKHVILSEGSSMNTTIGSSLGYSSRNKLIDEKPILLAELQHLAYQHSPISVELVTDSSIPLQSVTIPSLTLSSPLSTSCVRMIVPVDIVGVFLLDLPVAEVETSLRERVVDHIRSVAKVISWKEGGVSSVTVHHIPLINQHCPVTIVYPHTSHSWEEPGKATPIATDELYPTREQLHEVLCLEKDRPYFKVPRSLDCSQDSMWVSSNANLNFGPQLLNPHLQLKNKAVPDDCSLAVVHGNYLYFHYMQDNFNDNGWGCAYRSLQTLWSWFLLQGYTDKQPPTHRAIQEALVAAKDKELHFIDSKEWIGSFEVSTCLAQLLQVDCEIHSGTAGAEMASVGRRLTEHFRTHGTPVMIGGGVLAHTILGVCFNETTGDTQFLILDPHYTGREDIKTITEKGKWCGWKPVSFWKPKAQYSLCMPQRPAAVM